MPPRSCSACPRVRSGPGPATTSRRCGTPRPGSRCARARRAGTPGTATRCPRCARLTCDFPIPRRVKTAPCPYGVRSSAVCLVSATPVLDHVPSSPAERCCVSLFPLTMRSMIGGSEEMSVLDAATGQVRLAYPARKQPRGSRSAHLNLSAGDRGPGAAFRESPVIASAPAVNAAGWWTYPGPADRPGAGAVLESACPDRRS